MSNRTMVKVNVRRDIISMKTVSRKFKAPHCFIITKERILELADCKWLVVSDCGSYAELSLEDAADGASILRMKFSWLSEECTGAISGQKEYVTVPYDRLYQAALTSCEGMNTEWKMLSITKKSMPRIEFDSRRALHNVATHTRLRKKLGKFLSTHFQCPRSQRIVLYDNSRFDFYFQEYRDGNEGMSGAVILHGAGNLSTAYYGIHT